MRHTKIYGAVIIIAIALALFLLVLFGVNIKVTRSVVTSVETTSKNVKVYLEGKQYKYVKDHPTNYYYIYNPFNDDKDKCYLNKTTEEGWFKCVNTKTGKSLTWKDNTNGVYPSKLDFGSMKIFEYFIKF